MKKFVVQAFQQKYCLPSKVKEKSSTYLKNVQKIGKQLPTVKFIRKVNIKRKQNQHLSSAQKFVISFVYNFIWKRISGSFVDIITPSIIKSNQLAHITDYRNHVGFCQGPDTYFTYSKCQSTLTHILGGEKILETRNSLCDFSTENKSKGLYINESCTKNENQVISSNKERLLPYSGDLTKLECEQNKKNLNRTKVVSDSCLKTNDYNLSGVERNICKDFRTNDCNSNTGGSINKYSTEIIQDKTSKVKRKPVRNTKKYHNRKNGNNLQKSSKSNRSIDNNQPITTTLNNKKSNKQKSSIDGQMKNKEIEEKSIYEDNVSGKAENSLKIKKNNNGELYVSLTKTDNKIKKSAFLLEQNECLKRVRKTDLQKDQLNENGYSFVKENENSEDMTQNKSKTVTQLEAENSIDQENVHKQKSKTSSKTNEENSNVSKMLNKDLSLQNEVVKIDIALQSKPSKSYKKKKRKANLKKELALLTQASKDFQWNSVNNQTNKNKVIDNNCENYKLQNSTPLSETNNSNVNITIDKESSAKLGDKVSTDDSIETPEIGKTNLVIFDTTQDEAQLLIHEQNFGKNINSNLVNLNTVITEENSPRVSKKYHKETKSPKQNKKNNSESKLRKSVYKNLKPATLKPWKKNKDLSAELRNKTKSENTKNSNKQLNKETLVGTNATEVYYDKKTDGNELNIKSNKVISVTKKLDIAEKQVQEKPTGNSNTTKNLDYQNVLKWGGPIKHLEHPLKENIAKVVSSTRLSHETNPIVGTNLKKDKILENKTQLQNCETLSKPNYGKSDNNVSTASSTSKSVLESSSGAHLSDKNKTKNIASSHNAKGTLKPSNTTSLEYNDQMLSKTVADISQGINEIVGKEEFKLKMNQLLHNFTVTGQKLNVNNIQKRIKSQEVIVNTKHEKEKKTNKSVSQESVTVVKSVTKNQTNVNLKNQEPLVKKADSTKEKIPVVTKKPAKPNNVSDKTSVKESILFEKQKPLTVSVRPALNVAKDSKTQENMTRSSGKNVQRRVVAIIRDTTNTVSPTKVKTVISNIKSEQTIVGNTSYREVPTSSNVKQNEVTKKVGKSTIRANNIENNSIKTETQKKTVKTRPSE